VTQLKTVWGLEGLTHNDDFANLVSSGMGYWQDRNWDPDVIYPGWGWYCDNITSKGLLYPETKSLITLAEAVICDGGRANETDSLTIPLLNIIGLLNHTLLAECVG